MFNNKNFYQPVDAHHPLQNDRTPKFFLVPKHVSHRTPSAQKKNVLFNH